MVAGDDSDGGSWCPPWSIGCVSAASSLWSNYGARYKGTTQEGVAPTLLFSSLLKVCTGGSPRLNNRQTAPGCRVPRIHFRNAGRAQASKNTQLRSKSSSHTTPLVIPAAPKMRAARQCAPMPKLQRSQSNPTYRGGSTTPAPARLMPRAICARARRFRVIVLLRQGKKET